MPERREGGTAHSEKLHLSVCPKDREKDVRIANAEIESHMDEEDRSC